MQQFICTTGIDRGSGNLRDRLDKSVIPVENAGGQAGRVNFPCIN